MIGLTNTAGARGILGNCLDKTLMRERQANQAANWRAASSFPLVNYLPVAPVHEPECQLVNHVALVQLDSVDTEPMDACNALTARSEGVRREHVMSRAEHLRTNAGHAQMARIGIRLLVCSTFALNGY